MNLNQILVIKLFSILIWQTSLRWIIVRNQRIIKSIERILRENGEIGPILKRIFIWYDKNNQRNGHKRINWQPLNIAWEIQQIFLHRNCRNSGRQVHPSDEGIWWINWWFHEK